MITEFEPGLVSVIIPTFNRARMIGDTLNSLLNQSYDQVELIIVDDGSTDQTKDAVHAYLGDAEHHRVRYLHQEHFGGQRARNRGMADSRGEFIQFLDSDDLLHYKKLSIQVRVLQARHDLDFVVGEMADFTDPLHLPPAPRARIHPPISFESFFTGYHFITGAPLFRRISLLKVGKWDESLICHQEMNYFAKALAMGLIAEYTPEAFYYRRVHDGQLEFGLPNEARILSSILARKDVIHTALQHGLDIPKPLLYMLKLLEARLSATRRDRCSSVRKMKEAEELLSKVSSALKYSTLLRLRLRRLLVQCVGVKVYKLVDIVRFYRGLYHG